MDLIYTNPKRVDQGVLTAYALDLSYGEDENDFELTLGADEPSLEFGAFVYIEGTEYGGIVDARKTNTDGDTIIYTGRTWHGIMNSKVIQPDSGEDYYIVSGDANAILRTLATRLGFEDLFDVSAEDSGIAITGYQFNRYCKGYDGIKAMLSENAGKLQIAWSGRKVQLAAVPVVDYADKPVDGDMADLTVEQHGNKVNHLICLGQGDLAERQVVHLYVDQFGRIGNTQYYTGMDERTDVYDNSSAASLDDLKDGGIKRLKELLAVDSAEMDILERDDLIYDIGDIIGATEVKSGIKVVETVKQKIIRINNGAISTEYKTNQTSSSQSHSGGGTGGNGGNGGTDVYDIPVATETTLGAIKVGDNLEIANDGKLSVTTTNQVEQNNTKPITSAAVHAQVETLSQELSKTNQAVEDIENDLTDLGQTVDDVSQGLETTNQNVADLTDDLVKTDLNVANTNRKLSELTDSLAATDQTVAGLQDDLETTKQKISSLEDLGDAFASLEQSVHNDLNETNQAVEALRNEVSSVSELADTAKDTADTVASNLAKTDLNVANNAREISELENNLAATNQKVSSLEDIGDALVSLEQSVNNQINTTNQNVTALANELTQKAPNNHASTGTTYGKGDGANYGHVKLSASVSSTSDASGGIAATPSAVRNAYDLANTAKTTADTATTNLSKTDLNVANNARNISALQTAVNGKAPTSHASTGTGYGKGDGTNYGHVKLSAVTNSTSGVNDGVAATPSAVKSAYDLANGANNRVASLEQSVSNELSSTNQTVSALRNEVSSVSELANTANNTANALASDLDKAEQNIANNARQLTVLDASVTNVAADVATVASDLDKAELSIAKNALDISTIKANLTGYRIVIGSFSMPFATTAQSKAVSFGVTFASKPAVVTSQVFDTANVLVKDEDITTTGFTARLMTMSSSGTRTVHYIAIGKA